MSDDQPEGIVCLANDGVIDSLIALCASLRQHNPSLPMTVIPYDDRLAATKATLARFGYRLYDDSSLIAMDDIGKRYWPGHTVQAHAMRKFCAFWGPYPRFLLVDADIISLRSFAPYFDAFRTVDADLMYFAPDLSRVYKPAIRAEMVSKHGAVGFTGGLFMGRRGALNQEIVQRVLGAAESYRHGFVDFQEQSFFNFAVDTSALRKVAAADAVSEMIDAWAGMRLKSRPDGFVLADPRTPHSGRPVSLIHWAGYHVRPLMPYRRTFLRYRLAGLTRRGRMAYIMEAWISAIQRISIHTPRLIWGHTRSRATNWLAARGCIGWPEHQAE